MKCLKESIAEYIDPKLIPPSTWVTVQTKSFHLLISYFFKLLTKLSQRKHVWLMHRTEPSRISRISIRLRIYVHEFWQQLLCSKQTTWHHSNSCFMTTSVLGFVIIHLFRLALFAPEEKILFFIKSSAREKAHPTFCLNLYLNIQKYWWLSLEEWW